MQKETRPGTRNSLDLMAHSAGPPWFPNAHPTVAFLHARPRAIQIRQKRPLIYSKSTTAQSCKVIQVIEVVAIRCKSKVDMMFWAYWEML